MGHHVERVEEALDALVDPTAEEVNDATLKYPSRALAAVAAQKALTGGGPGGPVAAGDVTVSPSVLGESDAQAALEALEAASGGSQPFQFRIEREGGEDAFDPFAVLGNQGMVLADGSFIGGGPSVENLGFPNDATELTFLDLAFITGNADFSGSDLVAVGLPALKHILGEFSFYECADLESLDLSALETVGGTVYLYGNESLIGLDLSALVSVGSALNLYANPLLESLDLSALETVGGILDVNGNESLTTLDLPVLTTIVSFDASDCTALTAIDISALLEVSGVFFEADGCALTEAAVDAILVKLASLDGTGGTTSFDIGTVDLSGGTNAPPSPTGLAAIAVLEGRSNTVNVNSGE